MVVSAQMLDEAGDEVKFYHQLMGECLAATALWRRFDAGKNMVFERPSFGLFGREPGKWDEVVVTLAGMLEEADASRFVEAVARVDPFLAVDCILKGPARVNDAARGKVVMGLVAALNDRDGNVRRWAAGALGRIGDARALEALVGALGDEDGNVRMWAAMALWEIGDARALEALVGALGDEDEDVRYAAASALKRIGTPEALDALRRAGY